LDEKKKERTDIVWGNEKKWEMNWKV
jgi:hypothetical protein